MNRVLVTGGAGFIGGFVVEQLLSAGKAVRVLDNLSTGSTDTLDGLVGDLEFQRGDIRDEDAVRVAVEGVDGIIHLAADISVPDSLSNPLHTYSVNVMGTLTVLEEARRAGVRSCVIASSAAVYGEPVGSKQSEDSPTNPLSPYGASKLACEQLASLYSRTFSVPTLCLRLFNVYGPRQRHDSPYAAVIPIFLSRMTQGLPPQVFGDGHQRRDFVFVGDVARALIGALGRPDLAPGVYNVASGMSCSLLDLIAEINRSLGTSLQPEFLPEREGDIRESVADISRARHELGFSPAVSLAEGISRIVHESVVPTEAVGG